MKNYLKGFLIASGLSLCFLLSNKTIQAKVAHFIEVNFEKTQLFSLPPPLSAPLNDECSGAIELVVNPTCNFISGTVDFATQSMSPGTCNGITSLSAFDVWYKFAASSTDQIITVKGSGSFDAVIMLMNSCNGTLIGCADNSGFGGTENLTTTNLTAGSIYYIRIYHYGNTLPTTPGFEICISLPAPPPINDECVNAIPLNVDSTCVFISGSTAGATQSGPADTCASFSSSGAFDVWYKFVATATNNIIKVQGSLSFDAVIVLKDSCNGMVLSCSDKTYSGGMEIIKDSNLIIGNTYYIRVYSYGSALPSTPAFDICVSLPAPPPLYDNCSNAILLNVDSVCNYTQGSVEGSSQSMPPDSCNFTSASAYDVWYQFVADSSGQIITVKGSPSFDAVVSIWDSCSGSSIACSDFSGSGGIEKIYDTSLIAGNTYFVRVYAYGSELPSTTEFEICIATPPPIPANDNCNNPIILSVDSICNSTIGSVAGATQSANSDSCTFSNTSFDVWFAFVATATNNIISVQGSYEFDAVITLRESCNGAVISCIDNTTNGGKELLTPTGLVIGNMYSVRVYHYGSMSPETPEFEICVSYPPTPPINDDCSGAITLTANSNCSNTTGTVIGSTQNGAADECSGFTSSAAFDVWYKFIAVATNQTITLKGAESFDAVISLKDSCGAAALACTDLTTTGGTEVINSTGLTIGNTYYIRVYHYGSSITATPEFDICLLDSGPMAINNIENVNDLINVYPNPANDNILLTVKSNNNKDLVKYIIMNVNGQIMAEDKFLAGDLHQNIDISFLTSGIYNIKVSLSNRTINKKIVVMNK